MAELLPDENVTSALDGPLSNWSREGDDTIRRDVTADSFAEGIALVDRVAVVADERNHHPDIDIRWTTVTFRLSTHSAGGLTQNDLDLAAEIDRLAD
jgi:4a-hydroxytetrahydrobiopterin dehydratase